MTVALCFICTLTIVSFDYNRPGVVTFSPGDPDEKTIQLEVIDERTLEGNETLLLIFDLGPAAVASGARIGPKNQSRVTIINDDSKFNH